MNTKAKPAAAPLEPVAGLDDLRAYAVPRAKTPVDLRLDGNEGSRPDREILQGIDLDQVRDYPNPAELQAELASRFGATPDGVLITAGADEGIDRVCRSFLGPGRQLVMPTPSFEMLRHYAKLTGANVVNVPWPDEGYPVEAVQQAADQTPSVVAVVSPNNPTGRTVTAEELRRIAESPTPVIVLLDHAYVEYGDEDLTAEALRLSNVIVARTLSKAWGLAGLRVGYLLAHPDLMTPLQRAGGPYPVSALSMRLGLQRLRTGEASQREHVATVRNERERLTQQLRGYGLRCPQSEANFVLARGSDPLWTRDAMAGMGIAIRAFPGLVGVEDALRITCPGDQEQLARLSKALGTVFEPQALLFDMDGVLADVSESYRAAIAQTAATYGVRVSGEDIAQAKREGDANNDWVLTRRLMQKKGVEAGLEEVTERFESIYQGTANQPGLKERERLLIDRDVLVGWAARLPLAVVTGRPQADADWFLRKFEIKELFDTVVSLHDGPVKPDPAPVRLALQRLSVERAWMIGDTPDDILAARRANVLPLAVMAPSDASEATETALLESGAARVLEHLQSLEDLLP